MAQEKMKEDAEKAQNKPSLTKAEFEQAFSGPAPFVNRIVLTVGPTAARLSFLETHPQAGWHFRSAVTMSVADLVKTRDLIDQIMAKTQIASVKEEDEDDA